MLKSAGQADETGWHLAQNQRDALVTDLQPHLKDAGLTDARQHRLWELAERAFDNLGAYELYVRWARNSLYSWTPDSLDMPAAVKWLSANDLLVRAQLARRADGHPGPESTGPLEAHIKWLRHRLAYRAQSLRNAPRTNQLLRLMVAGRNSQADERAWAKLIRQHLVANDGRHPDSASSSAPEGSDRRRQGPGGCWVVRSRRCRRDKSHRPTNAISASTVPASPSQACAQMSRTTRTSPTAMSAPSSHDCCHHGLLTGRVTPRTVAAPNRPRRPPPGSAGRCLMDNPRTHRRSLPGAPQPPLAARQGPPPVHRPGRP